MEEKWDLGMREAFRQERAMFLMERKLVDSQRSEYLSDLPYKRMEQCGLAGAEIERSGGASLVYLMYFQVLKNHPELHMADLLNKEFAQGNDLLADYKREAAKQMKDKLGTPEGIAEVYTDTAKFLTNMDMARELSYIAGVPDTASAEERRRVFLDPENDATISGFNLRLGAVVQGFAQTYYSLGRERSRKMYTRLTDNEIQEHGLGEEGKRTLIEIRNRMSNEEVMSWQHAFETLQNFALAENSRSNYLRQSAVGAPIRDEAVRDSGTARYLRQKAADHGPIGHMPVNISDLNLRHSTEDSARYQQMTEAQKRQILQLSTDVEERSMLEQFARDRKTLDKEAEELAAGLRGNFGEAGIVTSEMEAAYRRLNGMPSKSRTPEAMMYDINSLSSDAVLSDRLSQRIQAMEAEASQVIGLTNEFLKAHPDIVEPGDKRDFSWMFSLDGLDEKKKRETVMAGLEDYYSGDPVRRKRVLDGFYDRIEQLNVLDLDLSVLTDHAPSDPEAIERSEEDVFSLIKASLAIQSVDTKMRENPEYSQQRFPGRKKEEIEIYQNTILMAVPYIISTVLPNSGLRNDGSLAEKAERESIKNSALKAMTSGASQALCRYHSDMSALEGKKSRLSMGVHILKEDSGLLPLSEEKKPFSKTQCMVGAAAFDKYFMTPVGIRPKLQELGLDSYAQMFYIDGKNAYDRTKEKYVELPPEQMEKAAKAELMAAVISGEHHVDAVHVSSDEMGRIQLNAHCVVPDLKELDEADKSQKRWYQSLRSKKSEVLNAKDEKWEQRLGQIENHMSERAVAAAQKKIAEAERQQRTRIDISLYGGQAAGTAPHTVVQEQKKGMSSKKPMVK